MALVSQWTTAISTDRTDFDTLKKFKSCGIDAIELSVACEKNADIDWDGLSSHAKEAGITLWSYHLPFSFDVNIASLEKCHRENTHALFCSLMDRAFSIGIRRFVIHPSSEPIAEEDRTLSMAYAKESLKTLCEYASARGGVICVENLPRTCLGRSADEIVELLSADSRLRFCFDVNHLCLSAGCTHHEFLEKLSGKLETVHMSDYDFVDEKHFFPGNGLINWNALISEMEEKGYSGPFLMEGGFSESVRMPAVPYGKHEQARQRQLFIKTFSGKEEKAIESMNRKNPLHTVSSLWYASENHIPVLGHRGICAKYPENTLPSFEAALDLGVDLIEFDVNLTKDGELVVIHDNTIDRTCEKTGRTRDYTLSELKSFNFSSRFAPGFAPTQIPTLREVLELVKKKSDTVLLNVEIKDYDHAVVDATIAMLREYDLEERSVIACFNAEVIRYVKSAHPQMRTQGFPARFMQNFTEETYDCMFGMGITIRSDDEQLKADIELARSKGILVWLYCADTEEAVKRCAAFGMDNITGNDPQVALDTLRALGLHK